MKYNPLYIIPRLTRRFCPLVFDFFLSDERHGSDYLTKKFGAFLDLYRGALHESVCSNDLEEKVVLEFGGGKSNWVGLGFLALGFQKLICIERFLDRFNIESMRDKEQRIKEYLNEIQLSPTAESAFTEAGNAWTVNEKILLHKQDICKTGLDSESVDLVVSSSVLEHVDAVEASFRELRRILKRGGLMIHFIDLRDHFFAFPLEMLKYSERCWRRYLNPKGGFGQNRMRWHEYIALTEKNNFKVVLAQTELFDENILEIERRYFADEYKTGKREDLLVSTGWLVARKE